MFTSQAQLSKSGCKYVGIRIRVSNQVTKIPQPSRKFTEIDLQIRHPK